MKKINKIVFLMVMLILLPLSVKADMGVPEIQPYEAYITNPNGINVYCREGDYTLELDDIVEVVEEYGDEVSINYKNNCSGSISINDIKPIIDEYDPIEHIDEVKKLDVPRKIKIIKEDGVNLYSGPSSAFKKISNIPNNTELTYSYSSGDDNGIKPVWLYVKYENKKGWIKTGEGAGGEDYLLFYFNNELPIVEDTKLETKDNKEILVPKGTVFNEGYMTNEKFGSSYRSNLYYVEYNNVYGRIQFYGLQYSEKVKLLKSLDIYDSSDYDYDNPDGTPVITMKGNKIGTVAAGAELSYNIAIQDYEFNIAYIEYEGQKGWLLLYNGDNEEDNFEYIENSDNNNEEITTTTTTTTKPIIKNNKKPLSAKNLIYLCIGGAVIISLTAVVILVLINKKKKSINTV